MGIVFNLLSTLCTSERPLIVVLFQTQISFIVVVQDNPQFNVNTDHRFGVTCIYTLTESTQSVNVVIEWVLYTLFSYPKYRSVEQSKTNIRWCAQSNRWQYSDLLVFVFNLSLLHLFLVCPAAKRSFCCSPIKNSCNRITNWLEKWVFNKVIIKHCLQ